MIARHAMVDRAGGRSPQTIARFTIEGHCECRYIATRQRAERASSPLLYMTLVERLISHTTMTAHGLQWTGSMNVRTGYPQIRARRTDGTWTVKLVHRVWYEYLHGEIPAGHDVDHTCTRLRCLEHLQALPAGVNRSSGRWRHKARYLRRKDDLRYRVFSGRVA